MTTAPFHRLLSFYSNRSNYPDTQTIRLTDSLRGNLALGLDFPAALGIAIGRHLFLRNTSFFSLNIHVPSVKIKTTPLEGVNVDEKKDYSCSEIVGLAAVNGLQGRFDALGLWALAADVKTGMLSGEDVVGFQRGTLFEGIEKRRKVLNEQRLPLWRGGPISAVGHSWVVKRVFGVDVYQSDYKGD